MRVKGEGDEVEERFKRQEMISGAKAMDRLHDAHVAVFGLGGVGGYAAEALARGGIGELSLIDRDVFGISNINRQIGALNSTIGRSKAEVMAERVCDINPNIIVHPIDAHYNADNRDMFFKSNYDYIIDAIDLVSDKLDLIVTAIERGIPIISSLGTGNKLDPLRFQITDISKTANCPLAKVVRKELRKRGIIKHRVLFSGEDIIKPDQNYMEELPPGRRSIPGSVSWVPACAGLMLAGDVILQLCGTK